MFESSKPRIQHIHSTFELGGIVSNLKQMRNFFEHSNKYTHEAIDPILIKVESVESDTKQM